MRVGDNYRHKQSQHIYKVEKAGLGTCYLIDSVWMEESLINKEYELVYFDPFMHDWYIPEELEKVCIRPIPTCTCSGWTLARTGCECGNAKQEIERSRV